MFQIVWGTSLDEEKVSPFAKILIFRSISLCALLQNCPTCEWCILLNFPHFWVFLDFLEISKSPLNNRFGFISIGVTMLNISSKQNVDFLLTLKRTCNVLIHNFQMKHFLPKLVRHEVEENWILFKMSCGGKISDKVWESYARSKFSWLFLRKP